ncbi:MULTISPECIES: YkvI family membrane protein [Oceanobacillus]|uniref:Membrane protein YkvI n=2 Tax=Bacillales TaxID=1385 RepID=A0A417YLJ9_9BACI|nr:hypothetical protein [Oceanobacillus profundus]MCM3399304.1 hypothetical protein [Oceanobacillus profundus]RHW34271.1 hypothetical protein D1B32_03620 [Oceanobacillus profundus]
MKKSLQVAGAYVGLIVGAGFASGQEVMQFFTSFGIYSVIGTIIAGLLFAFLGMHVLQLGTYYQTASHREVIYKICGRYFGFAIDLLITFFLFGVAVVMIAGSGSIFEQQFGIPPLVGNLIMTVAVIVTLCLNVNKVIAVISSITPYLLVLIFIITGYSLFTSDASFSQLNALAEAQPASAPNFIIGALLYVSYNLAAGFAMLAVIGGTIKDRKTAGWGGILGGIGLGLLLFLINLSLFMNIGSIQEADMPTLVLATEVSPIVGILMAIALLGMIFNTAVGMLYAFTARLVPQNTRTFKGAVVIIGLLAFGASFIGFTTLVGTVYPITGYLGFVLIIAVIISWVRLRKAQS